MSPTAEEVLQCLKIVVGADTAEEIVTIENFAAMLDWLGPLEKGSLSIYKLNEMFKKPYFHGIMTNSAAERVLAAKRRGTYLVSFVRDRIGYHSFFCSPQRRCGLQKKE
jgi:hypothetical protein